MHRELAVSAKVLIAPLERPDHLPGIGIQQQLRGIESMAAVRSPGAMGTQPVDQTGTRVGQVTVPHVAGVGRQRISVGFVFAGFVKQAQLHFVGMGRKHRKVDALAIPMGTQWPRAPSFQFYAFHSSITVARGGKSRSTDQGLPCQATCCAVAMPNGVPCIAAAVESRICIEPFAVGA